MKSSKAFIILIIILSIFVAGCSDAKNIEKQSAPKNSKISVKVGERTTTEGTETSKTLDKNIEKIAVNSLKSLFSGKAEKDLFLSDAAFKSSKDTFRKEELEIDANIHYLKSDETSSLISIDVQGFSTTYQIYIDNTGKIIGFESNTIIPIDNAEGS